MVYLDSIDNGMYCASSLGEVRIEQYFAVGKGSSSRDELFFKEMLLIMF